MVAAILVFGRHYLDFTAPGIPRGIDLGNDLSFLGTLRSELLDSGRLLTWWSVAYDGMPLLGHPNAQFFYAPLTLPSLAFGTAAGVRVAYVFSLLLAGGGMYFLARLLGPRPWVAAWAGLLFAFSGGFAARIHAGHLQKILAAPYIPLVLAGALLMARAGSLRGVAFWGGVTGLLHGIPYLAGDTSIPLFLLVTVPIILIVAGNTNGDIAIWHRVPLGLASWGTGLLIATGGKLLAAPAVLAGTIREVNPYFGSQDIHWIFTHFAFPFFNSVPGLLGFSYGPRQIEWGWGWWEYTQYIGIVPVALAALAVAAVVFRPKWWPVVASINMARREALAFAAVFVLAAFWLANASSYSPVHWLFEVVPGLDKFRVPSRALMVVAPIVLALAAVGMEVLLRSSDFRAKEAVALMALAALGVVWWVNTGWFTPFNWVCEPVPGLDVLPLSACGLILGSIAIVAIGFGGYAVYLVLSRPRWLIFPAILSALAIVALGDVYHATQAIPGITELSQGPSLRRVMNAIQEQDSGPFLVGLGSSGRGFAGKAGFYINKVVRYEFAERGISVASDVSPLVPEHQYNHQVIGPEQRLRYRVLPASEEVSFPSRWSPLMQDGEVAVVVNNEAQGDAWLVNAGAVTPLSLEEWRPGEFVLRANAPAGALLVVPANAFDDWRVSVDGGPSQPASEFDGYAAALAEPGEHTYRFFYAAPMLPAILIFGTLPWALIGILVVWGIVIGWRRLSVTTGSNH